MGGGRYGVALTEIEAAIRLLGIRRARDCFRRVHTMICAARIVLMERDQRDADNAKREAGPRG